MMMPGEPRLSEVERNMSEGVMTIFYKDGDYRSQFFGGSTIIQFLVDDFPDADDPTEEAMMHLEERAVDTIKKELVPAFQTALALMRTEEGEPEHEGFEVFWRGEMVWQEFAESYTPLPRIKENAEEEK